MAMKPCPLGKRHKWVFLHNVKDVYKNGRNVRIALRGLYWCECGERKFGGAEI